MRSLRKRSLNLNRHNTSIALEPEFWSALERMAAERATSLVRMLDQIDADRGSRPMASACRVAVLVWALAGREA
jgi:predicted DNA-binding ribbon-helix-helix protein